MRETLADIAIAAVPVIGGGLFLKWACAPVVLAFGAGLRLGKILGRRETGRHAAITAPAWRGEPVPARPEVRQD